MAATGTRNQNIIRRLDHRSAGPAVATSGSPERENLSAERTSVVRDRSAPETRWTHHGIGTVIDCGESLKLVTAWTASSMAPPDSGSAAAIRPRPSAGR